MAQGIVGGEHLCGHCVAVPDQSGGIRLQHETHDRPHGDGPRCRSPRTHRDLPARDQEVPDKPWQQIHELLIQAALTTPYIEAEPRPFVLQTKLDDWYVVYQINAYTRHPEHMAAIFSHLHQHIQDEFFEAGVEIMSPHYMGIRNSDQVFMPNEYLHKDGQKSDS